jgi:hypothetical protein
MKRMILVVLGVAAAAAAQQATQQVTQQVIELQDKQQFEAAGAMPGPAPIMARFVGTASAVKGAPYSAEATTEIVQMLADGNRISNKTSNKSYRDSEGRTRTEITPGATGAWMPDTKPFSVTVIDDPVSGDHITLNNNNKQATRFSFKGPGTTTTSIASAAGRVQNFTTMVMRTSGESAMPMPPPPLAPLPTPAHVAGARATTAYVQPGADGSMNVNAFYSSDMKLDVKKESLGKQVIEGVECTGIKETSTIPAGTVGNDRAIETVTERWYSPDLQLDVMTKTTDPRFGETTYRLGNIIRAEQPKSLFEVPADYKLEEPAASIKTMKSDVKQ